MEAPKELPAAVELERSLLGGLIYWTGSIGEVAGFLLPEHLYDPFHATIYREMLAMTDDAQVVELPLLWQRLRAKDLLGLGQEAFRLGSLTQAPSLRVNLEYSARILVQYHIQRELIAAGGAVKHDLSADPFDMASEVDERVASVIEKATVRGSITTADIADEGLETLDTPQKKLHSTGFQSLDRCVGGFQAGDLIVLAARPSMGKTATMLSSAYHAGLAGHSSLIFSLEVDQSKADMRMVSIGSGIPLRNVVMREYATGELNRRHEAHEKYRSLPIFWNFNTGISLAQIRAEATRRVRRDKVSAIYIDQLNWITPPKSSNRNEEVGNITRSLKKLAMNLEVPIILLHQLNRAVETRGGDKTPKLADLRDSGNVEQDAQLVLFAYRPEYYGITDDDTGSTVGRVDIIIAKQSMGALDTVPLRFNGPCASVHDDWSNYGSQPIF